MLRKSGYCHINVEVPDADAFFPFEAMRQMGFEAVDVVNEFIGDDNSPSFKQIVWEDEMKIGLRGAQGTGKTTLAKAYSDGIGIPYLDAKVGDYLSDIGVDLSRDDMPVVERMKVLKLMVAGHIASITEGARSAQDRVYHRSHADRRHGVYPRHCSQTLQNDEVLELYAQTHMVCLDAAAMNFNLCLMLRPGVQLSPQDHCRKQRASLQPFYVNHINMLMASMILSFSQR